MRRPDESPPLPLNFPMLVEAEPFARARGMGVFLTKMDSWSGAQIIPVVDDLRAEINQFTAAATETCSYANRSCAKAPW